MGHVESKLLRQSSFIFPTRLQILQGREVLHGRFLTKGKEAFTKFQAKKVFSCAHTKMRISIFGPSKRPSVYRCACLRPKWTIWYTMQIRLASIMIRELAQTSGSSSIGMIVRTFSDRCFTRTDLYELFLIVSLLVQICTTFFHRYFARTVLYDLFSDCRFCCTRQQSSIGV